MRVVWLLLVVGALAGLAGADEKAKDAPKKEPLPTTVSVEDPKLSDQILIAQLRAKLQEMQMQVLQAEARATQCQWAGATEDAKAKIEAAAKASGITDLSKYDFDAENRRFQLRAAP